jgi:hypothetical protein
MGAVTDDMFKYENICLPKTHLEMRAYEIWRTTPHAFPTCYIRAEFEELNKLLVEALKDD